MTNPSPLLNHIARGHVPSRPVFNALCFTQIVRHCVADNTIMGYDLFSNINKLNASPTKIIMPRRSSQADK
jgi:hypothetical protein